MLSSADAELVIEASTSLTRLGLEAAFLVPTATGLSKSIMDATGPVRAFLKSHHLHDYDAQGQGEDHKVVLPAVLVGASDVTNTKASLYRPSTKLGDPRIWISKLPSYASAGDLLVLVTDGQKLFVVNASSNSVWLSRESTGSPLANLLGSLSGHTSDAAEELLGKLRKIAAMGYVPSVRDGDTGVGSTLEHLLKIKANSSTQPDYRGIEIKSTRRRSGGKHHYITLFASAPNWKASSCKNGEELIAACGYPRSAPASLYCTIAERPNPQGIYLAVNEKADVLECMVTLPSGQSRSLCQWDIEHLRQRLANKHNETFWVKACAKKDANNKEYFHYIEAEHTRAPITSALPPLIRTGVVTVDFTLKLKPTGRSDNHGYQFRIRPKNLHALFPPSIRLKLTE